MCIVLYTILYYTTLLVYVLYGIPSDTGKHLHNLDDEMGILNKKVKGNVSSYLKYFIFRVHFHIGEC